MRRIGSGAWLQRLSIPERRSWARCVEVDLEQTTGRLHTNDELIRRSFYPGVPGYLLPEVKSGESLPEWLMKRSAEEGLPILACNALHTNFVRGNGFVVVNGRLICKPPGSIPLDGERHQPLDGAYTSLVLAPRPAKIVKLEIQQGKFAGHPGCDLAISGPSIVSQGKNTSSQIPVRLPAQGQTLGDEVNFTVVAGHGAEGPVVRTLWTALGVNAAGRLLAVSVFGGNPCRAPGQPELIIFRAGAAEGLTLPEMAELMIQLGALDAILAGGSGDTQQSVGGAIWCAQPRAQTGREQVSAPMRGLGAILAIYG